MLNKVLYNKLAVNKTIPFQINILAYHAAPSTTCDALRPIPPPPFMSLMGLLNDFMHNYDYTLEY